MFITLDSPQATVMMPVKIARSLDQMNYGVQRGEIAPPEFVEVINSMADDCVEVHKFVLANVTRPMAVRICKKIKPIIPELLKGEEEFKNKYAGLYGESVVAMERWFENMRILVGEIIYIARGKKIDEKELDAFMIEHAARQLAASSPKDRIIGKSAVMAMFEN